MPGTALCSECSINLFNRYDSLVSTQKRTLRRKLPTSVPHLGQHGSQEKNADVTDPAVGPPAHLGDLLTTPWQALLWNVTGFDRKRHKQ